MGNNSNSELRIGARVRLRASGEAGIVVWLWEDDGMTDAYVAFFGNDFPRGKPASVPYVLRYAATSLDLVDP